MHEPVYKRFRFNKTLFMKNKAVDLNSLFYAQKRVFRAK